MKLHDSIERILRQNGSQVYSIPSQDFTIHQLEDYISGKYPA